MDLLDRVGKKGGNKNSPDRIGLFQPQSRKAKTLLLAWLLASLRSSRSEHCISMSALGQKPTFNAQASMSAECQKAGVGDGPD